MIEKNLYLGPTYSRTQFIWFLYLWIFQIYWPRPLLIIPFSIFNAQRVLKYKERSWVRCIHRQSESEERAKKLHKKSTGRDQIFVTFLVAMKTADKWANALTNINNISNNGSSGVVGVILSDSGNRKSNSTSNTYRKWLYFVLAAATKTKQVKKTTKTS